MGLAGLRNGIIPFLQTRLDVKNPSWVICFRVGQLRSPKLVALHVLDFRLEHGHAEYVVVGSLMVNIVFIRLAAKPSRPRPWTWKRDTRAFVSDTKWPIKSDAQDTIKLVGRVP